MTIQALMREVQRIIGDEAGSIVSKELLLILINAEVQRVGSMWPNTQRLEFSPTSSANTFDLNTIFDTGNKLKIKRVLINGAESKQLPADEIERLVQP